jgi:methyl-accepting chemotaxis protein
MKFNIITKLVSYFLILTIIVAFFTTFIANRIIYNNIKNEIEEQLKREGKRLEKTLEYKQGEILNKARILSSDREIISYLIKNEFEVLKEKIEKMRIVLELDKAILLTKNGELIFSKKSNTVLEDRPYDLIFRESLKGKEIQEILPRDIGFEIRAASPIIYQEKVIGVILLGYYLDMKFANEFKNLTDTDIALIFENKVIYTTLQIPLNYIDSKIIFSLKEKGGYSFSLYTMKIEKEPYSIVIKPIYYEKDGTQVGFIATIKSQKPTFLALRKTKINMLIFTAILVILVVVVGISISRGISIPISNLTEAAIRISEGIKNVKVELDRKDEFGILSQAFNKMTENLQEIIEYQKEKISQLSKVIEISATGDLTKRVEITSSDEFGKLSEKLNYMIECLSKLVKEIDLASKEVSQCSEKILDAALKTAKNTSSQVLQITQVVSATAEMNASISEIANTSFLVADQAASANQAASFGGKAIEEAISAMEQITLSVKDTAEKISSLKKISSEIEEIVITISDIAKKINLLALNAAIEAARAGEAGKGFAVVADEIRTLADNSAKFSEKIKSFIDSIQKEVNTGIEKIEETVRIVEEGVKKINTAGISLKEIISLVEKTSSLTKEISISLNSQKLGSEEVTKAVHNLNQIIEDTEELAHTTEKLAKELNGLSQNLGKLIEGFKIN